MDRKVSKMLKPEIDISKFGRLTIGKLQPNKKYYMKFVHPPNAPGGGFF